MVASTTDAIQVVCTTCSTHCVYPCVAGRRSDILGIEEWVDDNSYEGVTVNRYV